MSKVRSSIFSGILFGLMAGCPLIVGAGCDGTDTSKPSVVPANPGGLSDESVKQQELNEKNAKEQGAKKK